MIRNIIFLLFLLSATAGPAFAGNAAKGDINHDLKVDLTDVILALQMSAGMSPNPAGIYLSADVNSDQKIGLAEAIYAANALLAAKDITAYSLLGVNAIIAGTAISVTLPPGTSLTSLVATFSTTGTSVKVGNMVQASGSTANNFAGSIIYTVAAFDGSTKNYMITAAVATSGPTIAGCPIFPVTAIFNARIDNTTQFPAHANSATWKSLIDSTGTRRLHLDWGTNEDQSLHDTYWGIPYNVVDGTTVTTNWPTVAYTEGWPDESDCAVADGSGGYNMLRDCSTASNRHLPIPPDANVKVEGGYCPAGQTCPDGDHHILVVEKATCRLWEAYYAGTSAGQSTNNGPWELLCSAAWDLNSLVQRLAGWTSGDAAGFPILPLLVRVDEANAGEVKHALRITLRSSVMKNTYVWPARHQAGRSTGSIPFGAILRLRADFVIPPTWTTQAKAIATAMKQFGAYVADNGSDMFIQGEPSAQWQGATWDQLHPLRSVSLTLSA